MRIALPGSMEYFDLVLEDWANHVERLEQYFEANGIYNVAKRQSTFLSFVGPSSYKLLRSILAPVKLSEKTFEELTEVLKTHYNPPPSEVMRSGLIPNPRSLGSLWLPMWLSSGK